MKHAKWCPNRHPNSKSVVSITKNFRIKKRYKCIVCGGLFTRKQLEGLNTFQKKNENIKVFKH